MYSPEAVPLVDYLGAGTSRNVRNCPVLDYLVADTQNQLYVLARGIRNGTHTDMAEQAAIVFKNTMLPQLEQKPRMPTAELEYELQLGIQAAHAHLLKLNQERYKDHPKQYDGAMLDAAVLRKTDFGGLELTYLHIGSGKICVPRKGMLNPITTPHTVAREMRDHDADSGAFVVNGGLDIPSITMGLSESSMGNGNSSIEVDTYHAASQVLMATASLFRKPGLDAVLDAVQAVSTMTSSQALDIAMSVARTKGEQGDITAVLVDVPKWLQAQQQ